MQRFRVRPCGSHPRGDIPIPIHVSSSSLPFVILRFNFKLSIHVKIYDSAQQQFAVPESMVEPPPPPTTSFIDKSDLVFGYESSPFAFWITRRSDPNAIPIFDTRISSLPPTPIPPYNASDPSTAFDGFPLLFENQYLQVSYHRFMQSRAINTKPHR